MLPVPVPISSARSARVKSADRTMKSTRFKSIRKFCPSLFLGCRRLLRKRSRRYDCVWRGTGFTAGCCYMTLLYGLAGQRHRFQIFEDILREQIDFEIDRVADPFEAERGDVHRVWNQRDAEAIRQNIDKREADAIDGDGALTDHLPSKVRGARNP